MTTDTLVIGTTTRPIEIARPGLVRVTLAQGTAVIVEPGADDDHVYVIRDRHTVHVERDAVRIWP